MNVVILAGGFGTRLAEETEVKPKPMVEIGDRPILWHIMKGYASRGFKTFFVALGYKGDMIKRYFLDYQRLSGDLRVDLGGNKARTFAGRAEDWTVHLIDTGLETHTGGRVRRMKRYLDKDTFMVTYGDGVADLEVRKPLKFHRSHGKIATLTAVRPPARFGSLVLDGDNVSNFAEKPQAGEGWINGGFLVFEPRVFDYLEGDLSSLEADALSHLASDGQLTAYRHNGFWQCMDTVRDRNLLQKLWQDKKAPWKTWP